MNHLIYYLHSEIEIETIGRSRYGIKSQISKARRVLVNPIVRPDKNSRIGNPLLRTYNNYIVNTTILVHSTYIAIIILFIQPL